MPSIHGRGTPETVWRRWLPGRALLRCRMQDIVPPPARLVVLAPHPDDEVLACGGLVALHVAAGGDCLIVAASDGEAADPGLGPTAATRLAATRRAERRHGLLQLGAERVPVRPLSLPDGALACCLDSLEQALQQLLRPGDVLLTTWRDDGHPDHEACGTAAARAAPRCGARLVEAPVWMWHWAEPDDARVPWPRLRALPLAPPVRRRKQQALAAHGSQLAPRVDGRAPVLGRQATSRMRRSAEHFLF